MKGFTLVEMLVVVLILGILVSVSVPQYQKAVARVKYGNLRSYVEQIYKAERMYYLANGTFTMRVRMWMTSGHFAPMYWNARGRTPCGIPGSKKEK